TGEVHVFTRVGRQIKEKLAVVGRRVKVLPPAVDRRVHSFILFVQLPEDDPAGLVGGRCEQRSPVQLHGAGVNSGGGKGGGRDVQEADRGVRDRSFRQRAGPGNDERNPGRGIEKARLP